METKKEMRARMSEVTMVPLKPALAGVAGYGQLMGISQEEFNAAAKSLEGRSGDPATPQPKTYDWL